MSETVDLPVGVISALRGLAEQGYPISLVAEVLADNGFQLRIEPLEDPDADYLEALTGTVPEEEPEDSPGTMVALYPGPEVAESLAVPGGLPAEDLHVTLAYLGKEELSPAAKIAVLEAVEEACSGCPPLAGQTAGVGQFENGEERPLWAAIDVVGLAELRHRVVDCLVGRGLPVSMEHGFTPHMTLKYLAEDEDPPEWGGVGAPLYFSEVSVKFGHDRLILALPGPVPEVGEIEEDADVNDVHLDAIMRPRREVQQFVKDAAKRFTLAPWYVPDQVDAHGEWATADETQRALWDYVRSGDRMIRLQHNRAVVAGEWVEIVTWPFTVTLPMQQADGSTVDTEFPPNTTFIGVVWEPWAWQLVLEGKVTGMSIGGQAIRVESDGPGT